MRRVLGLDLTGLWCCQVTRCYENSNQNSCSLKERIYRLTADYQHSKLYRAIEWREKQKGGTCSMSE